MNYIVYNAHEVLKSRSIFMKVINYFFEKIISIVNKTEIESKKIRKYAPGLTAISAVRGYKLFTCFSSHGPDCRNSQKIVILSNVQLKLFMKRKNDMYREMSTKFNTSASTIQNIFYNLNEYINFSNIKIINNAGKISDCKPVIENFLNHEYQKGMSDEEITDGQTEDDFYEGIVRFLTLNPNDAVKYITYEHSPTIDNPSQGYDKFVEICAGRTANHECCSLLTKPKCKFLEGIFK